MPSAGFWARWPTRRATTSRNRAWAQRLYFGHTNAVDNLAVFAPLVLILNAMDYSSRWTVLACAVYFWARLAHAVIYAFGIVVARTLAFIVSFVAQVVLFLAIFGLVCKALPKLLRHSGAA